MLSDTSANPKVARYTRWRDITRYLCHITSADSRNETCARKLRRRMGARTPTSFVARDVAKVGPPHWGNLSDWVTVTQASSGKSHLCKITTPAPLPPSPFPLPHLFFLYSEPKREKDNLREKLALERAGDNLKEKLALEPARDNLKEKLALEPARDNLKEKLALEPARDNLKEKLALEPARDNLKEKLALERARGANVTHIVCSCSSRQSQGETCSRTCKRCKYNLKEKLALERARGANVTHIVCSCSSRQSQGETCSRTCKRCKYNLKEKLALERARGANVTHIVCSCSSRQSQGETCSRTCKRCKYNLKEKLALERARGANVTHIVCSCSSRQSQGETCSRTCKRCKYRSREQPSRRTNHSDTAAPQRRPPRRQAAGQLEARGGPGLNQVSPPPLPDIVLCSSNSNPMPQSPAPAPGPAGRPRAPWRRTPGKRDWMRLGAELRMIADDFHDTFKGADPLLLTDGHNSGKCGESWPLVGLGNSPFSAPVSITPLSAFMNEFAGCGQESLKVIWLGEWDEEGSIYRNCTHESGKTGLKSNRLVSNTDLPVIGSQVYCESHALDRVATETSLMMFLVLTSFGEINLKLEPSEHSTALVKEGGRDGIELMVHCRDESDVFIGSPDRLTSWRLQRGKLRSSSVSLFLVL
uniref:Uncharacterized protein n=1 Tax=Timema douglasi TaxID=61478 RepID=A0A7R8VK23_TIMDO|nr:unnamed protein product [Timema douglasi]